MLKIALLAGLASLLILCSGVRSVDASVRLNELMFSIPEPDTNYVVPDSTQDHTWIELRNPGPGSVNVGGWTLAAAAGTPLATLPSWSLPADSYLVLHFTTGVNDSDFADSVGHFYTPPPTNPVFSDDTDECGLFDGPPADTTLIDFVAWTRDTSFVAGGVSYGYALAAGQWSPADVVPIDYVTPDWGYFGISMAAGTSLGRDSLATDTDASLDFDIHGGPDAYWSSPGLMNLSTEPDSMVSPPIPVAKDGNRAPAENRDWLVMIYMDTTDRHFFGENYEQFKSIERGLFRGRNNSTTIHVAAQTSRTWKTKDKIVQRGARYYFLPDQGKGNLISQPMLVKGNVKDAWRPKNLTDFVVWAETTYVADKTALVLVGHGDGWKGTMLWESDKTKNLNMKELRSALKAVDPPNRAVDVVVFVSCMMGMSEVVTQIHDCAEVALVSQESRISFKVWESFLGKKLSKSGSGWSSADFAKEMINVDRVGGSDRDRVAINLSRVVPDLVPKTKAFADALIKAVPKTKNALSPRDNLQVEIRKARRETHEYPDRNFIDLYGFAAKVKSKLKKEEDIETSATALMGLFEQQGDDKLIIKKKGPSKSHGLSIYFPEKMTDYEPLKGAPFDDPRRHASTGPRAEYRYCPNQNKTPCGAPDAHHLPPLPDFQWLTNNTWHTFLERYYEPAPEAMVKYGKDFKKRGKEVEVFLNEKYKVTAKGSSDIDMEDNKLRPEKYHWDTNPAVNSDATDSDHDCLPAEKDDDTDVTGEEFTITADEVGTFKYFLSALDDHHLEATHTEHFQAQRDSVTVVVTDPAEPSKVPEEKAGKAKEADVPATGPGGPYSWGKSDFESPYGCLNDDPLRLPGLAGNDSSSFWTSVDLSGDGDFAMIQSLTNLPPIPDAACSLLSGCVLTFYDPFSGWDDHPPGQYNLAYSPTFRLTDNPGWPASAHVIRANVYADLNPRAGTFIVWKVRTGPNSDSLCVNQDTWSPWRDLGLLYHGQPELCGQMDLDVSALIPSHAESVQIAVGVENRAPFRPEWAVQPGNASPYFDDVELLAFGTGPPKPSIRQVDLLQDAFSTAGGLMPTEPARMDAGVNVAPSDTNGVLLGVMPGDSLVCHVARSCMEDLVVEMCFQVLPGPCINSTAFGVWESGFAQEGSWSVVRMDTAVVAKTGATAARTFMSRYHEDDPLFAARGSTEIFPDDLFTPGTEIRYFFRTSYSGIPVYTVEPDTTGGNAFSARVLPFLPPGSPCDSTATFPCVLYVDASGEIDSTWALKAALHATTEYDVFRLRAPGSAQGTGLGSRMAQTVFGRETGPHLNQLTRYSNILWNTGERSALTFSFGESLDPSDDIHLLTQWLNITRPDSVLLWVTGSNVVTDLLTAAAATADFANSYLGVDLIAEGYPWYTGDFSGCPGVNGVVGSWAAGLVCGAVPLNPDVLTVSAGVQGVEGVLEYDFQMGPDEYAAVSHNAMQDSSATGRYKTVTDAFGASTLRSAITCAADSCVGDWVADVLAGSFFSNCGGLDVTIGTPDPAVRYVNRLEASYPNPMSSQAHINFSLRDKGIVTLKIFSVTGRVVRTLVSGKLDAGPHHAFWDGRDNRGSQVANGIYFYGLKTGSAQLSKKMVLLR